nr:unnamed protein product [Callosobruchus analis]
MWDTWFSDDRKLDRMCRFFLNWYVNDWFDVFNVSSPVTDSRARNRAYGLALEEQNKILDKMSEVMSGLKVFNCRGKLPFQKAGGDKEASDTQALIYMVCKDNLPLRCTEKEGMSKFLNSVIPLYKPPSRTSSSNSGLSSQGSTSQHFMFEGHVYCKLPSDSPTNIPANTGPSAEHAAKVLSKLRNFQKTVDESVCASTNSEEDTGDFSSL